jgi:two-component system chemotaxis sensor kinase CheA
MDDRLLEIFRTESDERVARISTVLLRAEAAGDGDADDIDELFRDVHSIKGSAGMFGLDRIGALAGTMEDALADARRAGRLPGSLVPRLLQAADAIRAALDGDGTAVESARRELRGSAVASTAVRGEPPPRTLRVGAEKVDRLLASVGEAALHRRRLEHLISEADGADAARRELEHGDALITDLQDAVLGLRTLPLETIVGGLPRAIRDIATECGREVRLELEGTETPLDRSVLDGISEVLVHLLRNAVSHGIEPPDVRRAAGKASQGTVRISAGHRGGLVAIACSDDGRGVSQELLSQAAAAGSLVDVLAEAGFSTADHVTDLSGRGVGLDAVKRHVEALGGSLEVDSTTGRGTTVTLLVPLTLAILPVLIIERGGQRFGIPVSNVLQVMRGADVHDLRGRRSLAIDGHVVPLGDLADVLGADDALALPADPPIVLIHSGGRRVALACDRLHGDPDAVVKPLGSVLGNVPGYLGGAVLDDGKVALLLDPARLIRATAGVTGAVRNAAPVAPRRPKVLVVDDQFTVRELERTILEAAGYRVVTAGDGLAALEMLRRERDVDVVVSDVEMPGTDGLAMLEAIRAQPEFSSLPVIIVTSRDDEAARERGAAAGADAWVVKSQFDQQALLETVSGFVDLR